MDPTAPIAETRPFETFPAKRRSSLPNGKPTANLKTIYNHTLQFRKPNRFIISDLVISDTQHFQRLAICKNHASVIY